MGIHIMTQDENNEAKNYWRMGGTKMRTLGRLFNSFEQETVNDGDQGGETNVGRYFNFPIKGEMIDKDGKDGMIQTLRNIETDFNEIARSDQRADISILRQFSYELITSKTFKALMMMAIVINTILMVLPIIMASNDTVADSSRVHISIVENVIVGIFIFEILVKLFALQHTFWYDGWNVFDVIVVTLLWVSSNTLVIGRSYRSAGASVGAARILRFIKVLRSMKSVKALKDKLSGLSLVIDTIVTTIPELLILFLLMFIISILFIILGGTLFSTEQHLGKYFDDFFEGFFTTFVVLTQDGWVKIFNEGFTFYQIDPASNQLTFALWLITFSLMVIIFGFIIGSLFVAAVVTNLDKAMLEQREEQNEDFLSGVFDNEEGVTNEEMKSMREREIRMEYLTDFSIFATHRHKIEKQVLHKCASGKRTSERVEDKLLLLEAL